MNKNRNAGDLNTGNRNAGDLNAGDLNTGDRNAGDLNTGNRNAGDLNAGDLNTGDRNAGDFNTGDFNTGNRNAGDLNTGDFNTGNFNTGNFNTGNFNTHTPSTVTVFDSHEVDRQEFIKSVPGWLYGVSPVEWVLAEDMTDTQKADNPNWETTRGFNLTRPMHEAYAKAWAESDQDAEAVRAMPGFDHDVWVEITGIDLAVKPVADEVIVDGVVYVRKEKP